MQTRGTDGEIARKIVLMEAFIRVKTVGLTEGWNKMNLGLGI